MRRVSVVRILDAECHGATLPWAHHCLQDDSAEGLSAANTWRPQRCLFATLIVFGRVTK